MQELDVFQHGIDALHHENKWESFLHINRYLFARKYCYGKVLDAGCGFGYGAYLLSKSERVSQVLGVDASKEVITYAKRVYSGERVSFCCSDLRQLNLRKQSFNCIALIECLEHLPDPEAVLENLWETLKGGGLLVLTTPNKDAFLNRIKGRSRSTNPAHIREYGINEVHKLLVKKGFNPLCCEGLGLLYPRIFREVTYSLITRLFARCVNMSPGVALCQMWVAQRFPR
jgi:SAM-dependent methyltransferase